MTLGPYAQEVIRMCDIAFENCAAAEDELDPRVRKEHLRTAENAVLEIKRMVERFER